MENRKKAFLQGRLGQYLKEEGLDPAKAFACLNPACTHSKNSMKYVAKDRVVVCKECGISWDIFGVFEALYGQGWEGKLSNRYGLAGERAEGWQDDYGDFTEHAFRNARISSGYKHTACQLGKSGLRAGKPITGYVDALLFADGQEGAAFIVKTEPIGEGFCSIRCSDESCHYHGTVSMPYFDGSDGKTYISTDVLSAWYIGEILRPYLIVADDLDYLKKKVRESTCEKYRFIHTPSCDEAVIDGIRAAIRAEGRSFETWRLELPQVDFYHAFKASPMNAFAQLTAHFDSSSNLARVRMTNTIIENMKKPQRHAISTGFPRLDAYLDGGLQTGLYVIAGVPGVGKTTFMLQMCDKATAQGYQGMFFSFEMRANKLIAKSISRSALISFQAIHGRLPEENEVPTINDVKRHMSNPQQADDAFMRAMLTYREEQARSVMLYDLNDRFVGEDGITYRYTDIDALIVCVQSYGYSNTVVFIDYLQMLKIIPKDSKLEKQNTERQTIDEVLDRLRELSEEMEIPIVLISTLNRGQQGYANSIKMEHLKESGGIEYKADVILALNYKDSKESSRKEGLYGSYYEETLHILKNRNGEDGGRMPYKYFGAYGYFEEDETE